MRHHFHISNLSPLLLSYLSLNHQERLSALKSQVVILALYNPEEFRNHKMYTLNCISKILLVMTYNLLANSKDWNLKISGGVCPFSIYCLKG